MRRFLINSSDLFRPVIPDLMSDQYNNSVTVIAFNTAEC
jgi:hypothetical protein